MKYLVSMFMTFMLMISLTSKANTPITNKKKPAPVCCSAHCKMGDCSINGGASYCSCGCDLKGNPHCEGHKMIGGENDPITYTVCVNQTQMGNLNGVLSLYQSFNSQAGAASASIVSSIISLFTNNNYILNDNSANGNVQTYQNLRASLDAVQLSNSEWAALNQYLDGCSEGTECNQ